MDLDCTSCGRAWQHEARWYVTGDGALCPLDMGRWLRGEWPMSRHSRKGNRAIPTGIGGMAPDEVARLVERQGYVTAVETPPAPLRRASEHPTGLALRVLVRMALIHSRYSGLVWVGDPRPPSGITTSDLAAVFKMTPFSAERQALNGVMTDLRKQGYLHFEFDRMVDPEVRWWLTDKGAETVGLLESKDKDEMAV